MESLVVGRAVRLDQHGVKHRILETREAAKLYNELAKQGVAVAGLFHLTC